jgi:hypothetical protein
MSFECALHECMAGPIQLCNLRISSPHVTELRHNTQLVITHTCAHTVMVLELLSAVIRSAIAGRKGRHACASASAAGARKRTQAQAQRRHG